MMEIAQAAAMAQNLNVWVDGPLPVQQSGWDPLPLHTHIQPNILVCRGSLKDAEWYAQQFEKIRRCLRGAD